MTFVQSVAVLAQVKTDSDAIEQWTVSIFNNFHCKVIETLFYLSYLAALLITQHNSLQHDAWLYQS